MPKKILFYTHGLVDGGGERLWSCLATAFKARGENVLFAQDFEADENRSNLDASIPLFTLGRNHIKAIRELTALLKREQPDVALCAIGGSNIKFMIAKWLAKAPTRTIISYHGFREWRTGILSFLTYFFLPVMSSAADCTIAVSDGLREQLIKRWGARPDKTITILNPVFFPQSAPVPTAEELRARSDTVLAVGRFVAEKDFITLVRGFARIENRNARLVILGKGPDEAKVRAEIERLGIGDRVSLPGYCKEPWRYYAQAKCFASSSNSEPFGNVIVEAMAYGLPVVATACSGPQEILQHGEYGRIVAIGSDLQMAHAIAATLENPGSPAARRKRADDFCFDVRVPAYEKIISGILNAGEAAPSETTGAVPAPTRAAT